MSAVAAILRFYGEPVREGEIERLTDAMKARSPDGITVWRDGCIALGHGQLHGTPESLAERQPLSSSDNRFRLIWDGRLDNRAELQHELSLHRVVPRDSSDAEIVLQMFVVCGDVTPRRLLGDFAFAIWDSVERRLFCARDHIGARPFYYCLKGDFFALASEDEALLTLPNVSTEPCEDRLIYALVPSFDAFDWRQSWLVDVSILMPGTQLTIDVSRKIRRESYWQMTVDQPEIRRQNFADYQREFSSVFSRAVSDRLRSHKPVAAMMSGGMDSASICATAARILRARGSVPLSTFSAIEDDESKCVESQSILQLAARLQVNPSLLRVPSFTGFATRTDLERVVEQFVHPTDVSIPLVAMMCLGASRSGHRVLLHGASGDVATHTPLAYLGGVFREAGLQAALRELRLSALHHTYLAGLGQPRILGLNAYRLLAPKLLKQARIQIQERFGSGRRRWSGLAPEFVASRNLAIRMIRSRFFALSLAKNGKDEHLAAMFPIGVLRGLEGYDRVAGHFGLEMRDPWSDRRVLELMLRAPTRVKTGAGWTKLVVRTDFESDVGAEVVWRNDKSHLGWRFAVDQHPVKPGAERGSSSIAWATNPSDGDPVLNSLNTLDAWISRIAQLGNRDQGAFVDSP